MRTISVVIKTFIVWALQIVTCPLRLLPVKKNRVLIVSCVPELYGNLHRVCEELLARRGNEIEIIWSNQYGRGRIHFAGMPVVKYPSLRWLYCAATARAILTDGDIPRIYRKRRVQLFINTWHAGGAYKLIGDMFFPDQIRFLQKHFWKNIKATDLYISSSKLYTRYTIEEAFHYKGEVLNCGMPRNDILFSAEQREVASCEVRREHGLDDCYVVLYAPTFRGRDITGFRTNYGFPYGTVLSALEERFQKSVRILNRAHPGCIMDDGKGCRNVIDVTGVPDMQKLLCAADMLITDYSSCIWDFALLGRPCMLYIPDLEDYKAQRGMFTPVEEWPGITCNGVEELRAALESFDAAECARRAKRYLEESGSYENGTATRQLCDWILQRL